MLYNIIVKKDVTDTIKEECFMTKAQERALEKMKRSMENSLTKSEEVKEWTITEHEQFVSVVAVTGVKNDEGTYAFYVRNKAQFFIQNKWR